MRVSKSKRNKYIFSVPYPIPAPPLCRVLSTKIIFSKVGQNDARIGRGLVQTKSQGKCHSSGALDDDDPVKMELLQTLHHHLCMLKEGVKDNMKQTLLSSLVTEEFQEKSECGADGEI